MRTYPALKVLLGCFVAIISGAVAYLASQSLTVGLAVPAGVLALTVMLLRNA